MTGDVFDLAAFAARLRRELAARGINQQTAANQMRVTKSTLSRVINAKLAPDVENFCRMVLWLLEGREAAK